jgi:hypothetical protein
MRNFYIILNGKSEIFIEKYPNFPPKYFTKKNPSGVARHLNLLALNSGTIKTTKTPFIKIIARIKKPKKNKKITLNKPQITRRSTKPSDLAIITRNLNKENHSFLA